MYSMDARLSGSDVGSSFTTKIAVGSMNGRCGRRPPSARGRRRQDRVELGKLSRWRLPPLASRHASVRPSFADTVTRETPSVPRRPSSSQFPPNTSFHRLAVTCHQSWIYSAQKHWSGPTASDLCWVKSNAANKDQLRERHLNLSDHFASRITSSWGHDFERVLRIEWC